MSTSMSLLLHPCLQRLIECIKYSDEIFAMQGILSSREAILSSDKDFPAVKPYYPLHFNTINMHEYNRYNL